MEKFIETIKLDFNIFIQKLCESDLFLGSSLIFLRNISDVQYNFLKENCDKYRYDISNPARYNDEKTHTVLKNMDVYFFEDGADGIDRMTDILEDFQNSQYEILADPTDGTGYALCHLKTYGNDFIDEILSRPINVNVYYDNPDTSQYEVPSDFQPFLDEYYSYGGFKDSSKSRSADFNEFLAICSETDAQQELPGSLYIFQKYLPFYFYSGCERYILAINVDKKSDRYGEIVMSSTDSVTGFYDGMDYKDFMEKIQNKIKSSNSTKLCSSKIKLEKMINIFVGDDSDNSDSTNSSHNSDNSDNSESPNFPRSNAMLIEDSHLVK